MMNLKTVTPTTTYFEGGQRGVILFHAYTGTPNDVRQLGRYLNKQNYSVLLPLFSGHGTDDAENILASGTSAWTEDLKNSLATMKAKGIKEVAVFGLSLGGVFALKAIAEEDDFILGGGSFCSPVVPGMSPKIAPTFVRYAQHLLKVKEVAAPEQAASVARVKNLIGGQLADIEAVGNNVYQKLGNIKKPIFLAQAGADELIDASQVFKMAKALDKAPFTLNWYPNSGHVITVGRDRQRLQEDVLHFLNELNWQ